MKNVSIPVVDITNSVTTALPLNAAFKKIDSGVIPSMNVDPVLHEVRHALEQLNKQKKSTVIDLTSMPFAPGEKEKIRQFLATGEVEIQLNAMGNSLLYETSYPGVWWIEHRNSEQLLTGTYIEISAIPEIINASNEDIYDGLSRLTQTLSQRSESHER